MSVTTLDMLFLCCFQINIVFQCLPNITFCISLHFTQHPYHSENGVINKFQAMLNTSCSCLYCDFLNVQKLISFTFHLSVLCVKIQFWCHRNQIWITSHSTGTKWLQRSLRSTGRWKRRVRRWTSSTWYRSVVHCPHGLYFRHLWLI